MPIFRHHSPYYAPLSSSVWYLYSGTLYVVYQALRWIVSQDYFSVATRRRLEGLRSYSGLFSQGIAKAAEETARKLSSEIDWRVLIWTLESSDEEHELERFFSGLPGFWDSRVVNSRPLASIRQDSESLSDALIGFVHRTISSDLISETVRERRITLCRKALDVASLPINKRTFQRAVRGDWNGLLSSVEFGLFLRGVDHNDDPRTTYYSRSMVSIIIANARLRDDRWVDLTAGHLGVSKLALREYMVHGDSALLANLIYIIRTTIRAYSDLSQLDVTGWKIFETASRLDLEDTLPELQHDFCALWNDVVLLVTSAEDERVQTISRFILINSRRIYIALHQGTDSAPTTFSMSTDDFDLILYNPLSYPLCNVSGHRRRSGLTHIHGPEVVADTPVAPSDVPHAVAAVMTAVDPSTASSVEVASLPSQNPHHPNIHVADSPLPDDTTPIFAHPSLVTTLRQPGPPETRCAHSSASADIASVGLSQGMADACTSLAHGHLDPTVNSAAAALQNKETIDSPPTIQAASLLPIHHGTPSGPSASTGAFSHIFPLGRCFRPNCLSKSFNPGYTR